MSGNSNEYSDNLTKTVAYTVTGWRHKNRHTQLGKNINILARE